MHHQKAGDTARCKHHARDEEDSEIQLPHRRQIAKTERQQGNEYGSEDRSDEEADPSDVGREQNRSGLNRAEIGRVGDFEVDGRKRARDPGKEAGKAERQIADDVRVVTDKLHTLGIVPYCVAHPAQRSTRQRIHGDGSNQRPECHQVINLDLRSEMRSNTRSSLVRLAEMPASPPKKLRRINAEEATSSATPSEIIANAVPLRRVDTHPRMAAKKKPASPPIKGTSGSGTGSFIPAIRFMP